MVVGIGGVGGISMLRKSKYSRLVKVSSELVDQQSQGPGGKAEVTDIPIAGRKPAKRTRKIMVQSIDY